MRSNFSQPIGEGKNTNTGPENIPCAYAVCQIYTVGVGLPTNPYILNYNETGFFWYVGG